MSAQVAAARRGRVPQTFPALPAPRPREGRRGRYGEPGALSGDRAHPRHRGRRRLGVSTRFLARERSNDSPTSHDPLSMRDTTGIAPTAAAAPRARACRTSATASARITRSSELKSSSAPRPDRDGRPVRAGARASSPRPLHPQSARRMPRAAVAAKWGRAGGPSGVGGGGLAGVAGDCGGAGQAGTSEARRQWRCAATEGEVVAVRPLHPRIVRRHCVGVSLAHTVRRRATLTPCSKPHPSPPLPPPSACSPTAVRATLALDGGVPLSRHGRARGGPARYRSGRLRGAVAAEAGVPHLRPARFTCGRPAPDGPWNA